MKIDFLAEAMITPLSEESFSMAVDVLAQIFERGCVKNIRARIRPIEGQHANSIVSDFAANH